MGVKRMGMAVLMTVALVLSTVGNVSTVSTLPQDTNSKIKVVTVIPVKKAVKKLDKKPVKKIVSKPKVKPVIKLKSKPVVKVVNKVVKPAVKKVVKKPVARIVRKPVVKRVYTPVKKPIAKTYYRKTARGMEISKYEYDLLARIVHAEAGDDGMASQIGVCNVVLNRVHFAGYFPSNIAGVIYQDGQFSPVADGRINLAPDAESYTAVDRTLAGENNVSDCQFFWADYVDKSNFLWSKPVLYKYGKTVFAN